MRFVKREPDHGYMGGYYLKTEGEASDEEIALMKDTVVEEICNEIRKIAKERDDFFIIKRGANLPGLDDTIVTTVAAKYILPTVKENYD
jgi:hypothetical protein